MQLMINRPVREPSRIQTIIGYDHYSRGRDEGHSLPISLVEGGLQLFLPFYSKVADVERYSRIYTETNRSINSVASYIGLFWDVGTNTIVPAFLAIKFGVSPLISIPLIRASLNTTAALTPVRNR